MIKQILLTALVTGFLGSIFLTTLQSSQTIPLILSAEKFEDGKLIDYTNNSEVKLTQSVEEEESAWAPKDGMERLFYTFLTNIFLATGFSFLLCTVYLYVRDLTLLKGLLAGVIGYLTLFALPSIGLTPEVPGTFAAALEERQLWWIMTVVASAIAFATLFFSKNTLYKSLAVVLLIAPHIVGAPHPEFHAGTAPVELFHAFVQASFVTNAIFWLFLGALSAIFYKKFALQTN